jgi:hypothetical protein
LHFKDYEIQKLLLIKFGKGFFVSRRRPNLLFSISNARDSRQFYYHHFSGVVLKIFISIAMISASLSSYAVENHPIMDKLLAGRNYTLMNSGSCPSRQVIALTQTSYDGFGPRLTLDFGTIMIPMIPVSLFNKGEWAIYKTGDVMTGNRQLGTLEIIEDEQQLKVTARAYKGWIFRKLQNSRSYTIKLTPTGFNVEGPDDICEYAK